MPDLVEIDARTGYIRIKTRHGVCYFKIRVRITNPEYTVINGKMVITNGFYHIENGGEMTISSLFQPIINVRIDNGIVKIKRGDK